MTTPDELIARAEAQLARLDEVRALLDGTDDPEVAVEALGELAQIAKDIEADLERARREAGSA